VPIASSQSRKKVFTSISEQARQSPWKGSIATSKIEEGQRQVLPLLEAAQSIVEMLAGDLNKKQYS
jgi:hypothetical protein